MQRHDQNRRWCTRVLTTLAIVFGATLLPSSPAAAGASLAAGPTFPGSATAGETGVAASITLTNNNTPPEVLSTVCRHDDASPGPLSACVGASGIVLTPSCGAQSPQFVVCLVGGADRDVFRINPTGTGSDACAGVTFTAIPLDDAFGRYRFDPPPGVHVVLPAPGSSCTISFTFDVLRMPTLDRQASVPGVQTAQIVAASVQTDTGTLGSGQGTTTPVSVLQAIPTVITNASPDFVLGTGEVSDVANVSGLVSPSPAGDVTFRLYGPDDPSCAGRPVFVDTQSLTVGADPTGGTATSASFTPTEAGTFRWVATYNGDVNNASVSGTCGDATESRVVAQATPAIVTLASAGFTLGTGQLSDQATVTGLISPVGPQSVTFRLFGPNDAACSSLPVFTSTVALTSGSAQSAAYTPTLAGTYRWIATYDGDANNAAVAGRCDDPTETRTVASPPPTLPPTTPTIPPTLPPTGGGVDLFVSLAVGALAGGCVLLAATRRRAG